MMKTLYRTFSIQFLPVDDFSKCKANAKVAANLTLKCDDNLPATLALALRFGKSPTCEN